jgi:hypothetical protein
MGGLQSPIMLHVIDVVPCIGHIVLEPAEPHVGEHTERPAAMNVWHTVPVMQFDAAGLHES